MEIVVREHIIVGTAGFADVSHEVAGIVLKSAEERFDFQSSARRD